MRWISTHEAAELTSQSVNTLLAWVRRYNKQHSENPILSLYGRLELDSLESALRIKAGEGKSRSNAATSPKRRAAALNAIAIAHAKRRSKGAGADR